MSRAELRKFLKRKLGQRELTFGSWIQIGHPGVAELMADAGYDWLCVDMEHGAIGFEEMTNTIRAIQAAGVVAAVRIPRNDPVWIHRCLDAGSDMLIIPMIANAEEAEAAIAETKYPPRGRRGFGYSRTNDHGAAFDDYRKVANDEIPIILQIEHISAIQELDAILDVEGVDGLFIGPLDLTGSMGYTGQMDHPEVVEALQVFRDTCRRRNCTAGIHIVHPNQDNINQTIKEGYNLIALGLDSVYLREASSQVMDLAKVFHG